MSEQIKTILTRENLQEVIKQRRDTYKYIQNVMSVYNHERSTAKDYDGRQILELLQNADDAGASRLEINLDEENGVLRIYNDGRSFSLKGMTSILVPDDSEEKVSREYIGNKGLGFRSLITWADEIILSTSDVKLAFSKEVAKKRLEELGYDIEVIRSERNLPSDCVPFPILGIPDVYEIEKIEGCLLEIKIKQTSTIDIKKNIREQMNSISGETLFFLRNVKTIKVNENELTVQRFNDRVEFNGNVWYIEGDEGLLPEDFQNNANNCAKYSIKIAVPEKKEQNAYPIYNFLPTKIIFPFPYIVHATLDVNSSRDYITSGENTLEGLSNRWILGKVAEVIKRCVEKELRKEKCDWSAYSMLIPQKRIDNVFVQSELGNKLELFCKEMSVFPTVCDRYVDAKNYWFYDNERSVFWKEFIGLLELGKDNPINRILKECPFVSDANLTFRNVQKKFIPSNELLKAISEISKKIQELENAEKRISCRANVISHLVKYKENGYFEGKINIPLLIDDDEKILSDVDVYTPKNEDYSLPFFMNIVFMSRKLYDSVYELLKCEIEKERENYKDSSGNKESVQRSLARIVGKITNLHEYDKNAVEKAVVSQANLCVKQKSDIKEKCEVIKEMVEFFKNLPLQTSLENVQLIDEKERIVSAKNMLFPTEINKDVFGENAAYVCDKDYWSFTEKSDYEKIMSYFGVNCFTTKVNEKNIRNESLIDFWAKEYNLPKAKIQKGLDRTKENNEILLLPRNLMVKIKNLPIKKVVLFLCLNNLDDLLYENYKVPYFDRSLMHKTVCNPISAQLKTALKYKVLNEGLVLGGRDDSYLREFGISDEKIRRVYAAISTDIDKLNPFEIIEILKMYSDANLDGTNLRDLYKLVVLTLSENKHSLKLSDRTGIKLWSGESENRGYHDANIVFYSDNETIPQNMIRKMGLFRLDYPLRAGTSKVSEALGLKKISDFRIKVVEKHEVKILLDQFVIFFNSLKPYFLLLSIENVKEERTKKNNANLLKNCKVKIVDKCVFEMDNNEKFELNDGEVGVDHDGTYYLKVSNCDKVSDLKENYVYCNAIAEIVCMALKLVRNDEFIHIVQNEMFMKQVLEKNYGKFAIEECREMLGLSNCEKMFWEKVFYLNHCDQPIDDSNSFYEKIRESFQISREMYSKVDFVTWKNLESWNLLNSVLKTFSPEEQRSVLEIVDLKKLHLNCYATTVQKYRPLFFNALWEKCNSDPKLRPEFLKLEREYGKLIYEDSERDSHKFDINYLESLKSDVMKKFGMELSVDIPLDDEPLKQREKQNVYDENFAKIVASVESLTEADLADFVDKNEIEKSLLYFEVPEGIEKKIKEYLKNDEENSSEKNVDENEDTGTDDVELEPRDDDPLNRESSGSGTEKDFSKKNRNNIKAGKDAEKIAYKELKKTYKNLIWHSENSDVQSDKNNPPPSGIVCDMWNPGLNDPKGDTYFEVKSESSDFKMSINEYNSMKNNPEQYEVVLVNRETRRINRHKFDEIDKLKKPFTFVFRFRKKVN